MMTEPRLDILGAALADATRSRILCEMMDGRAFTNKELACAAHVTAQTASAHLKHLRAVGLVASLRSGRCVYHRIANEDVAAMLEQLAVLAPRDHLTHTKTRKLPDADTMLARSCYNHIAGRLGVMITESLTEKSVLVISGDTVALGPHAPAFCERLGMDTSKRAVKLCLDWTERKHHISGPFASALMDRALDKQWLMRQSGSRALRIKQHGFAVLEAEFDLSRAKLEDDLR